MLTKYEIHCVVRALRLCVAWAFSDVRSARDRAEECVSRWDRAARREPRLEPAGTLYASLRGVPWPCRGASGNLEDYDWDRPQPLAHYLTCGRRLCRLDQHTNTPATIGPTADPHPLPTRTLTHHEPRTDALLLPPPAFAPPLVLPRWPDRHMVRH